MNFWHSIIIHSINLTLAWNFGTIWPSELRICTDLLQGRYSSLLVSIWVVVANVILVITVAVVITVLVVSKDAFGGAKPDS